MRERYRSSILVALCTSCTLSLSLSAGPVYYLIRYSSSAFEISQYKSREYISYCSSIIRKSSTCCVCVHTQQSTRVPRTYMYVYTVGGYLLSYSSVISGECFYQNLVSWELVGTFTEQSLYVSFFFMKRLLWKKTGGRVCCDMKKRSCTWPTNLHTQQQRYKFCY